VRTNWYTIGFAAIMCVVLSVMLSATFMALKDARELNKKLDSQKNILEAAGIHVATLDAAGPVFATRIEQLVITNTGKVLPGKIPDSVDFDKQPNLMPLYRVKARPDDDTTVAYVYPVQGVGLWSTLYGYLAVTPGGDTVKGLSFYKEKETPGLGAEIKEAWFRDNFVGKKLYDNAGNLVGIDVVKGKARDHVDYKTRASHMVDGISGATITANGVSKMMKVFPKKYAPFFEAGG